MRNKIGVVGSINTDLVVTTSTIPKIGETISGEEFKICFGGKGCNEAVASARLGAKVNLFSAVGYDVFSTNICKHLKNEKVSTDYIKKVKGVTGGIATITVCNKNNQIVVISGANAHLDTKFLKDKIKGLQECAVVGGMFEVPIDSLIFANKICKENGIPFVLNPSPIKDYPFELFENSTYVIVNEVEIEKVLGYDSENPLAVLEKYPSKLILTKGKDGCFYFDGKSIINIPAIEVEVVDTTGAGDTFLASFMVGISKGLTLFEALTFANLCAGLKTTKLGAQTGMPTLNVVLDYIKLHNIKINTSKLV